MCGPGDRTASARGSGYFPLRLVRPHLARGRLTIVPGGPEFTLSAYIVYAADADLDVLGSALTTIRTAARRERASHNA